MKNKIFPQTQPYLTLDRPEEVSSGHGPRALCRPTPPPSHNNNKKKRNTGSAFSESSCLSFFDAAWSKAAEFLQPAGALSSSFTLSSFSLRCHHHPARQLEGAMPEGQRVCKVTSRVDGRELTRGLSLGGACFVTQKNMELNL